MKMGICAARNHKKQAIKGELQETLIKARLSHDNHAILKEKIEQNGTLNPFKNPIVGRRLQELPIQSNEQSCSHDF